MLLLLSPAWATCDEPLFSVIPAPPPTDKKHGSATALGAIDGKEALGGRFSLDSPYPMAAWREVLLQAEKQDEWVPERFGYEFSEWIDTRHMYLRFNIGFLANTIHLNRQLVVEVRSGSIGDRFRTCWKKVDPTPMMASITSWMVADVPWQSESAGWWELTPQPGGGCIVNYQWWAATTAMPTALVRIGIANTLPDLLDAFEARVRSLVTR